ncbi:hypothetical protein AVEN_192247-1 [Araneus ventricosus]|uniref:Uncharacterized protein n=1 Tax=Araneus ventricosus TaxID=182803 RepID=A0A4Y2P4E5_ARAVE|nr:hypothetical protein AVEN_192247-1 [Araneus ventricosus]
MRLRHEPTKHCKLQQTSRENSKKPLLIHSIHLTSVHHPLHTRRILSMNEFTGGLEAGQPRRWDGGARTSVLLLPEKTNHEVGVVSRTISTSNWYRWLKV